ncbi:MAG TPA: hypothetical protein PK239_15390 [Chitinophagales bacterium]|nr:hypothetical protein [Chitinophagales bacterium]
MKQLSANWLTEGLIDAEYKKYILLAYLQEVNQHFEEHKLYPFLSDLVYHYRSLLTLKQNKEQVSGHFPKRIEKIDLEKFTIAYERIMHDDRYMEEIQAIVDFAIPKIQEQLNTGAEMYEYVSQKIAIAPIGIIPLQTDEGYLLICNGNVTHTDAYLYRVTVFTDATEKYRAIKTCFLQTYTRSITTTYESIKHDLIQNNRELPNPATFAVHSNYTFPMHETLLPVAKRNLMRFLGAL